MRSDLREAMRRALGDHVAAAWVFGSVARGEERPESDLDVAVLLPHDGDPTDEERRALAQSALVLEPFSPSGRVDIVVLGRSGPVFQHRVLREGELVVDRDVTRRIAFVTRTIIDYLDWEPTHRIGMEASLAGLAKRLGRSAA